MGVLSSMYVATSGLNAMGTDMSVIGNNITNLNTVGFKQGRAVFANVYGQTMTGRSNTVNTSQPGSGVYVEAIQQEFTQGSVQASTNALDMAVQGNGFLTVRSKDGQNHLVRTIALKAMDAGSHRLEWDGVTDQGTRAPKGSYSFEIDAMDGRHRPVPATPVETGTVTGILFEKGQPVLEVDGKPVAFGDISHVGEPRTSVSSRAQDKGPNRKTAAEDSLPGGEGASRNAGPIRKLPSTVTRRI